MGQRSSVQAGNKQSAVPSKAAPRAAHSAARQVDVDIASPTVHAELLEITNFIEDLTDELEGTLDLPAQHPHLRMAAHLIRNHVEARLVTPTSLIAASGVPYATANRRLKELQDKGLVEMRPRTRTGRSFSVHPSTRLIESWAKFCHRVRRISSRSVTHDEIDSGARDYYFGGSYLEARTIQPPSVLPTPIALPGGLRLLVHGDPTFMVMDALKRQFEQVVGCTIHQRAFSIDRLREEALRNAERRISRYDIIAVDLPWIGEYVEKGMLTTLGEVMDVDRLDPSDFHTAGWQAAHWKGLPYGVPSQTTPELMFYRRDLFAEAGLEPPTSTAAVLEAAERFHDPVHGRYGIAWNAARGTALGHTFIMMCADFGQPIFNLPSIAGGYDGHGIDGANLRPTIDTEGGLAAANYLLSLLKFSPPDILSMAWYERVRPYAAGNVAMAYGYTLLAPYFELDPTSPACEQTGYIPHPAGLAGTPIAPVGGYVLGIPTNLPESRKSSAAEALIAFTSPEAQKLYIQNGSRTNPRYSVGADPEVRRMSTIFGAIDAMSWRDELQFWPRPPVPEISDIIQICGEEFHDMLRGITKPEVALSRAQNRAERVMSRSVEK